jgi:hypothetical protein
MSRLGELTPLPADYLYPGDEASQKIYEKLSLAEKLNENVCGKWWSMYDLMKYFHSGFMPEEGETNYIRYEIDLTAPELRHAMSSDPNLKSSVDTSMMTGLTKLSGQLLGQVAKAKQMATESVAAATSSGLGLSVRRGGAKKKWRGGDNMMQQGMMMQPQGMMMQPQGMMQPEDPTAQIAELLKPENLEKECLNDVFQILFNSRNRIFITDSKPGNLALVSSLGIPPQPPLTGPPAPAPPVGGRRKTRKSKMGKKSGKTRRYRRKH